MTDIKDISTMDIAAWLGDATDAQLEAVTRSINNIRNARRQIKANKVAMQLEIGTKVRFTGGRPQYLAGRTGRIVNFRQTKVLVKLDCGPIGKFRNGEVVTPLTLLEVVR